MTPPFWVQEVVAAFWERAGDVPVPRDLRGPIARALPIAVVSLPGLGVAAVDDWLLRRQVVCLLGLPDRPLRACLVAHLDQGMIFIDGRDDEDDRRFSLAHELAHFLRHYWLPRRRAAVRFGNNVLAVFDGQRAAEPGERVRALLAGVPVGIHTHLMDRDENGAVDPIVYAAEREADLLAFELLAPADDVLHYLRDPVTAAGQSPARFLCTRYGMPPAKAQQYSEHLLGSGRSAGSLTQRLRAVR